MATPTPAPVAPSTTKKLEELEGMRKSGLITDAEFDAKRKELLDRM
ncbi:SHOCT domain-containing protein [Glutamicibacter sp. NPDC087344]